RLEFYRDEDEFISNGENIPVYREPVDSTFYEPNVIVSKQTDVIRPNVYTKSDDTDSRQLRNIVKSWDELKNTAHPLKDKNYRFIFHTPKYRHGAHTTPVDTDVVAIWFGPFGDIYRHDKRMPYITEMYVDINPLDAKELGLEDGDYAYIDADPLDRPFRNWKNNSEDYKVARLMCRIRYYPGTPRGVVRMWHNVYSASYGSVRGIKENPTGLAKNPFTGYQALFRSGSHQSCTRAWLKPTLMTDSMVRKDFFGQTVGRGFAVDIHCPTGAPREAMVKIEFAEPGGYGGERYFRPIKLGIRPTYESEEFKKYLKGEFVKWQK
ncbi:MAG: molybdopterin oxidoreductase, partial [bacterium]|nr:molybdopterin oxidoreductase [bacterium]